MSTLPGQPPEEREDSPEPEPVESLISEPVPPESLTGEPAEPSEVPVVSTVEHTASIPPFEGAGSVLEPRYFAPYGEPVYVRPERIPHLGHLSLFLLLLGF